MTYKINTYEMRRDAKKKPLGLERKSSDEGPDELSAAEAAARKACQAGGDDCEVDVTAEVGTGEKWLLGFKKVRGEAVRK